MDEAREIDVLAELKELRLRVAELEGQASAQVPEERSTRRGMLRLAGAAVVGGAAASLGGAKPAAAAEGAMVYGAVNDAGTEETELIAHNTVRALDVKNPGAGIGVRGNSIGNGTGLHGEITTPGEFGSGVVGRVVGTAGYGVVASGGVAQLLLDRNSGGMPIYTGSFLEGAIVANPDGLFYCIAAGSPGTFRKLTGPASAGAFHAVQPTRVYDSRALSPSPGLLDPGANRTITVAYGRDPVGTIVVFDLVPAGATAVAANITVTGTTGVGGYLAVNPGGVTTAGASTINWFGAGQNIANGVTLTLNANREVTVVCGTGGGSTHFIVDISGYYI